MSERKFGNYSVTSKKENYKDTDTGGENAEPRDVHRHEVNYNGKKIGSFHTAVDEGGEHINIGTDTSFGDGKHHANYIDKHIIPQLSNNPKIEKSDLIKALADDGHRESALLLKNWDEKDDLCKSYEGKMEKAETNYSFKQVPGNGTKQNPSTQYEVSLNGKDIGHANVPHSSGDEVHGGINWEKHPKVASQVTAFHNANKN